MDNITSLKDLMNDVEEYVLKNNSIYLIEEGYEYLREIITLYVKQHNLVESTLLLLDNNHNEEAIVLARSALNNYFLIGYLINDPDKSHLKEYQLQPCISARKYWKNIKVIMKGDFFQKMLELGKSLPYTLDDVNNNISFFENKITEAGFNKDIKLLNIYDLANKADEREFELYVSYYTTASRYEHSDITTLDVYKQKVFEEHSNNTVFHLNSSRTDEDLKEQIMSIICISYTQSLLKIINEITDNHPELDHFIEEEHLKIIFGKLSKLLDGEI